MAKSWLETVTLDLTGPDKALSGPELAWGSASMLEYATIQALCLKGVSSKAHDVVNSAYHSPQSLRSSILGPLR
jgi:hypothetical protein